MSEGPGQPQDDLGLDVLLSYLHESRGFDFTGYKRSGLARRVNKRLRSLGLGSYSDYLDYLQVHPDEFAQLFNAILVNATGFFRDPFSWQYLAEQVVPRILEQRSGTGSIRVWSAGCATGQEAYSIAMLLAEALGTDTFARTVKIYATDIDDAALNQARLASYSAQEVAGVPAALLDRYFEHHGPRYQFSKALRRMVIFGRHNLLSDAPMSRIDLVLCRNTLMYFNAEAQSRIVSSLHFALNDGGFMFLGKAEMLLAHAALFTALDLKRRVFVKASQSYARARIAPLTLGDGHAEPVRREPDLEALKSGAFQSAPLPQLAIDRLGQLAAFNDAARRAFGLAQAELGHATGELALCRKLDGLQNAIEQVRDESKPLQLSAAEWLRSADAEPLQLDVFVQPILNEAGAALGVHALFLDTTPLRKTQDALQQTTQELEASYEELQSTSEELETANEELQSTVEELETTNEELRSTNEELETANDELQAANDELRRANDELRAHSGELGRLEEYFYAILGSMPSALVVLDMHLHVQVWSARAQDLWGLRAEEVNGKNFLSLEFGLPVEQLASALRACSSGECEYEQLSLRAVNRRGRSIQCDCLVRRLVQAGELGGIVVLMNERAGTVWPPDEIQ